MAGIIAGLSFCGLFRSLFRGLALVIVPQFIEEPVMLFLFFAKGCFQLYDLIPDFPERVFNLVGVLFAGG